MEAIGGAPEAVAVPAAEGGGGSGAGGGIVSSGEGVGVSATATLSGAATSCGVIDAAANSPPSRGVEAMSICIGIAPTGGGGAATAVAGAANSGLISRPAAVSVPWVENPVEPRDGGGVGPSAPLGALPPSLSFSLIGTVVDAVDVAFGAAFFPPNLPPFSRICVAALLLFAAAPLAVEVEAAGVPGSSSSGYGDGYWARISYPA